MSFAIDPESPTQPSGTQNFSRLDNQTLQINIDETYPIEQSFFCYVYAINWQVLRIMGGIAAPVFAN